MSADRLGETEPMTDAELSLIRYLSLPHGPDRAHGYALCELCVFVKALATADAAGFARGVEAAAGVADEVSGRDDVPLLLRKSIWVAVRKDCASEIAAAIRALVTP